MPNVIVHPSPGRYTALSWVAPDEIPGEMDLAEIALTALEALRWLVEPLAVELALVGSDGESRLPRPGDVPHVPFRFLRRADLPEGVRVSPTYTGSSAEEVPRIDDALLRRWMADALDQRSTAHDTMVSWAELSVLATCVRLPEPGDELLVLHGEEGTGTPPIYVAGGSRWACGPAEPASPDPPVGLHLLSEGGRISLTIHVHWSCWTERGTPGRRALDEAIAGIRRLGWEEESTDLP